MAIYPYVLLAGKALRHPRRAARRLWQKLHPPTEATLFVFGGRNSLWPGAGQELYAASPQFRESVRETAGYVQELVGLDILPHFTEPRHSNLLQNEKALFFLNLALNLGLLDVLLADGIAPTAILGISLGEVPAAYAAGGLNRADAVRVCAAFLELTQHTEPAYYCWQLPLGQVEFESLAAGSPVPIMLVYEASPTQVLCFVHEQDTAAAEAFLRAKQLPVQYVSETRIWPYHTPLARATRPLLAHWLYKLQPQPLQRPFYSTLVGGVVPAQTVLPPEFWYQLLHQPVLLSRTLQAAQAAGYSIWVDVGPEQHQVSYGSGHRLSTLVRNAPEMHLLAETLRQLRRPFWQRTTPVLPPPPPEVAAAFREQFNLAAPAVVQNPFPAFAYLQSQGPLHFLPVHNAWLVVDYALADQILKQPSVFSSQVNVHFDAVLLGADPPAHTEVRQQLQQLLNSGVVRDLISCATAWMRERLAVLAGAHSFDFVHAVAIPVAQTVAQAFIGFPAEVLRALLEDDVNHAYLYESEYRDRIHTVLVGWLSQTAPEQLPGLAGRLRGYYPTTDLAIDDLAKLLRLLWLASTITTSALLSASAYQLLTNPSILSQLRQESALIPRFVEECLRLAPSDPLIHRVTTEAVLVHGQQVPARAMILLSLEAANRTPQVFEHPNELDLHRPARRHLAFGGGVHHCLGAFLARQLVQQLLEEILLPSGLFDESILHGAPRYFPSGYLRALIELPVKFPVPA